MRERTMWKVEMIWILAIDPPTLSHSDRRSRAGFLRTIRPELRVESSCKLFRCPIFLARSSLQRLYCVTERARSMRERI